MKFIKTVLAMLILALIAGGIYLGVADITVPQQTVTKEVSPSANNS
ncbi:MAG: hypothetical protein PHX61_03280 [Alphaproteobacteria bacterium]|nr:hypothetical protein [Alphaproteobacteria bacterium]